MPHRIPVIAIVLGVLLLAVGCTNKKVSNPIANIDSKQPDKVLFDRAMDAMKHNRFDVARLTLQTLINTYPDSEYIARAKLAIADSWYAEGGSASQAQAEIEYKDFITFFPNMPEAAEAQLKIANIHYQQMEKPDRDYTHAMRAEEEYRQLIMQFPDSKLVPEAKQRLREVQEVIADREYRVGRFYYLRQSYPAAIARLRSLVDKYPLYSRADEVLYLLGQSYESEVNMIRARPNCVAFNKPPNCVPEVLRARMIEPFVKEAAEAYSRILTRYPLMDRADDAKARLIALHQPVPKPTKAAVAQNKAEEDSRKSPSTLSKLMRNFEKHPSVADAARTGEPTLVDPTPMSASDVVQQAAKAMVSGKGSSDNHSVTVEVGKGEPPANQPVPRSDAPAATDTGTAPETSASAGTSATPAASDQNELKPNVGSSDANELTPNVPAEGAQALPPPQQVNEIQTAGQQTGNSSVAGDSGQSSDSAASSSSQQTADDDAVASSKRKKKKGIHKIIPF
ncbi:MAG TPA: outer membrane protein assembly factor BamD [Terriglobales bacterium]|nr:outer membrane protein assembly factor BamD [Terriglobales bacterium]